MAEDAVLRCENGHPNEPGAVFCGQCGAPLVAATATPTGGASEPEASPPTADQGAADSPPASADSVPGAAVNEPRAADNELGIPGLTRVEPLARGGQGTVYRAYDPEHDRQVAVKVLQGVFDDESKARFNRERRAMGSVSTHPGIVTIYNSGFTSAGLPYVVMEYMEGGSLADSLVANGPMVWTDVLEIGAKVADALETTHRAGVIHGDVKPENLLVSAYGETKLTDFGVASLTAATTTGGSSKVGMTVDHAPPEVLSGARPTESADIYALGSTLFTLIANRVPFRLPGDGTLAASISRSLTESVPDLRNNGIPAPVCAVIEQAMAKNPAERFGSAAAMGAALTQVLGQEGRYGATIITGQAPPPVPTSPPAPPPVVEPTPPPTPPSKRGRRIAVAVGVVVLLIAGAAGAALVLGGGDDGADQAADAEPAVTTSSSTSTTSSTTTTTAPTTTSEATTTTEGGGGGGGGGDAVFLVDEQPVALALLDVAGEREERLDDDGAPLCCLEAGPQDLSGTTYDDSLTAELQSCFGPQLSIEYDLGRDFNRFRAVVGLSDDSNSSGSVRFETIVDGERVDDRRLSLGDSQLVDVSVADGLRLELLMTFPDTSGGGCEEPTLFAVWGNAKVQ